MINNRLDNNELPFAGWIGNLLVRGVRPVDYDSDERLLALAVQDHRHNWSPYQEASGLTFRDDPPPSGQVPSIDSISPRKYVDQIARSGAAIFSYSGWFDGGYQLAAIRRHLFHHHPGHKLVLGPWDHGGKRRISPDFLGPSRFDHAGELLKFFDFYLKGRETGIQQTASIRYYTMGEERWKTADQWPPDSTPIKVFLQQGGTLSEQSPALESPPDHYQVDRNAGTGNQSRWDTLVGISLENPYPDRKDRDKKLLLYTSDPLPENVEVTGHPVVTIYLSSTTPDTNLFVYLEDVTPEGEVHYVTEGELRALHRRWHTTSPSNDAILPIPFRSFQRADAAPLTPGEVVPLTLPLFPTSYQFKQGHRLRLALAGADQDHFQILDGPPSVWEVWHTPERPSYLVLPVVR